MHAPTITATYLAVLALIYTALSIRVVGMRRGNRIGFGDGGNAALRAAIRAHAHFAEYVPIIILMLGALELFGTRAVQLHMLLATLLVSRILHSPAEKEQNRALFVPYAWPMQASAGVAGAPGAPVVGFLAQDE